MKSGDARVALIGFPSVGKVSLSAIGEALHFILPYKAVCMFATVHSTYSMCPP